MGHASPTAPAASLDAHGLRFALVVSRFNEAITTRLQSAAHAALCERGAAPSDVVTVWVPGAVEIPLVAQRLAGGGGAHAVHAVLALGAVVRGDTPHFDYVARIVADGVREVMLSTGVPVIFGVLTVDTEQQALDRAGGPAGDKGREAALTAIEMVHTLAALA